MTSSLFKSISTVNSISGVAQSLDDVWTDFLKLQISGNTKRTYAAALDDFFTQLTGAIANPEQIQEFLNLSQHQAVGVVLKYKGLLLDAKLAPATINTRLSAIKSLTNHARKLGQCHLSTTHHKEEWLQPKGINRPYPAKI